MHRIVVHRQRELLLLPPLLLLQRTAGKQVQSGLLRMGQRFKTIQKRLRVLFQQRQKLFRFRLRRSVSLHLLRRVLGNSNPNCKMGKIHFFLLQISSKSTSKNRDIRPPIRAVTPCIIYITESTVLSTFPATSGSGLLSRETGGEDCGGMSSCRAPHPHPVLLFNRLRTCYDETMAITAAASDKTPLFLREALAAAISFP